MLNLIYGEQILSVFFTSFVNAIYYSYAMLTRSFKTRHSRDGKLWGIGVIILELIYGEQILTVFFTSFCKHDLL